MGDLIVHEIGKNVPYKGTWQRLLFHWCAVLNCYHEWEKDDDLPHWHNERAQTGFLAAAVWRMGGVALEEYRTDRKKIPGRCDLYVSVKNLNCVLESKLEWLTTYSRENASQVKKKIHDAREQLQTLDKNDRTACEGLALCWGVATRSDDADDEKENLRRFAYGFKGPNRVIAAYYVPSHVRAKVETRWRAKGKSYQRDSFPGVIFIGETDKSLFLARNS